MKTKLKDVHHDLALVFDFRSDNDCELITEVFRTILDYHQIESNGRSEDEGLDFVDKTVEFFNQLNPPEEQLFQEFIEDHSLSSYPRYPSETDYLKSLATYDDRY